MKVKIRAGARICQDNGIKVWPIAPGDRDALFEIDFKKTSPGLLTLRGYGYGSLGPGFGAYGNGPIFVNEADIVKDEAKFNLARRFELLADKVRGFKSVLADPQERALADWTDKIDRVSEELDDLALDVIRYVKGGPA